VDRFTAAYLADRIGATFPGRINGVTRFGLFVTLDETGADGLVPMGTLAGDYYVHDEARHLLRGRNTGQEYRLGEEVEVILAEADPITGGMIMHLLDNPGNGGKAKVKGQVKSKARKGKKAPAKRRRRG
jgi:ribonuclease R